MMAFMALIAIMALVALMALDHKIHQIHISESAQFTWFSFEHVSYIGFGSLTLSTWPGKFNCEPANVLDFGYNSSVSSEHPCEPGDF